MKAFRYRIWTGLAFFQKIIFTLQARKPAPCQRRKKRAPFPAPCAGAATVEAALLTPVFLWAVCSLISIGQLLMIEGEMQHAAWQTLQVCAKEEAQKFYHYSSGNRGKDIRKIFFSFYDGESLLNDLIEGGKDGIRLSLKRDPKEEERTGILVRYTLKAPYSFVSPFRCKRRIYLRQRIYSGYLAHGSGEEEKDPIVYIARNGTVYHTHMDCSYICLKITDRDLISAIVESSSIRPCSHCAKGKKNPARIYITENGEHYHCSLSCSGLKRTVQAVRYSQIKGMRKCFRCSGRDHGSGH